MPEKTSFQKQNFILTSTKERTLCLMHTDSEAERIKQGLIGVKELEEELQEIARHLPTGEVFYGTATTKLNY